MAESTAAICWFRQDLRLSDNPAWYHAVQTGKVLPVYILDDLHPGPWAMGGASRWWLHHSLQSLNRVLDGQLAIFRGSPEKILLHLVETSGADHVHWNRCYEPWRIKRDIRIKEQLRKSGVRVCSHNGSLLWEPPDINKRDGSPYKVFTPFYRNGCLQAPAPRHPLPKPTGATIASLPPESLTIEDLGLLPSVRWDKKLDHHWTAGEQAALIRLETFLQSGLDGYRSGRDCPSRPHVSRLSPSLHFGEISPHTAWYAAEKSRQPLEDIECFKSELGWREFSYYLLYHAPHMPDKPLQKKFLNFTWNEDTQNLERWQQGLTGYPIVDAGMRELWQTGYMHNRVRMITGSFLVKNLLIHWTHGEKWFHDCLADADLACNSAGWQWVSGCGVDAAPYFRIFNPVTQGRKFDPDGSYTRRFVPELSKLPDTFLFNPWDAPPMTLEKAGIVLGVTYPYPVVDIHLSRNRALEAYRALNSPGS
ncbi:deoxyribodipyrimidine photo-lyase [Prosthecochloris sp. HL-130-GSB]|uniref:cryptochrome/photolyase family protein n=1 Tax=Prosthecochloris sp. HL-130-GSB TaxID=1974213 RepID=UPI000A1C0758|nr:deoxyribodipyrimidine photo-lyase [Prosthecochloris sp. HL-130-GSB]ARM30856.1 deoxyribodipyrimidine photolyase [Prosthecochloris sp. HL-130-GSB]